MKTDTDTDTDKDTDTDTEGDTHNTTYLQSSHTSNLANEEERGHFRLDAFTISHRIDHGHEHQIHLQGQLQPLQLKW